MTDEVELRAAQGWVAPDVAAELPGLRLNWVTVRGSRRDSPRALSRRLGELSNRYRGASVVAIRSQPIPGAHRAFFRQIGLDPDVTRIPLEDVAMQRLAHGAFRSRDLVHDALLLALIETGVAVWALDAQVVSADGLGIRATAGDEQLGSSEIADHVRPGRLVVADSEHIHALLFGEIARGHEVTRRTSRIMLFTIGVEGVPAIHLEEALWVAVEAIESV
jgi:DNA/RNA-binding domain of Phe-tRNA-synthetase-like protein